MKILIIYTSKYGTCEKASIKLAKLLNSKHKVELFNLTKSNSNKIKLEGYDIIILGGSIYAGKIQKELRKFCTENMKQLLSKKIALFICCGNSDNFNNYLLDSFGKELSNEAILTENFGYEYDFEKMNMFFRLIVKKIAKINKSTFNIKEENIKNFSEKLLEKL